MLPKVLIRFKSGLSTGVFSTATLWSSRNLRVDSDVWQGALSYCIVKIIHLAISVLEKAANEKMAGWKMAGWKMTALDILLIIALSISISTALIFTQILDLEVK